MTVKAVIAGYLVLAAALLYIGRLKSPQLKAVSNPFKQKEVDGVVIHVERWNHE